MKCDKDKKVLTINGQAEPKGVNLTEDDPDGWRQLQGITMQFELPDGSVFEFEAHNIRRIK